MRDTVEPMRTRMNRISEQVGALNHLPLLKICFCPQNCFRNQVEIVEIHVHSVKKSFYPPKPCLITYFSVATRQNNVPIVSDSFDELFLSTTVKIIVLIQKKPTLHRLVFASWTCGDLQYKGSSMNFLRLPMMVVRLLVEEIRFALGRLD